MIRVLNYLWLGSTALHYAAEGGHKAIVKNLVNYCADIHQKNNKGMNIIYFYLSIYISICLSKTDSIV